MMDFKIRLKNNPKNINKLFIFAGIGVIAMVIGYFSFGSSEKPKEESKPTVNASNAVDQKKIKEAEIERLKKMEKANNENLKASSNNHEEHNHNHDVNYSQTPPPAPIQTNNNAKVNTPSKEEIQQNSVNKSSIFIDVKLPENKAKIVEVNEVKDDYIEVIQK